MKPFGLLLVVLADTLAVAQGVFIHKLPDFPNQPNAMVKQTHIDNIEGLFDDFAAVILREIRDRFSGGETSPVFNVCYDWHSAVHCHWALVRLHRYTGRFAEEAMYVRSRLTADTLAAEEQKLRSQPSFERPYGRAWLLKLSIELDLWANEAEMTWPDELLRLSDYVASDLLQYFKTTPPVPETREYDNGSWAIHRLWEYMVYRKKIGEQQELEQLIASNFVQRTEPAGITFASDLVVRDFFSRFGNWVTLLNSASRPALSAILSLRPLSQQSLAINPVNHYRVAGQLWSRVASFRALLSSDLSAIERVWLEQAVDEHVERGRQYHQALRNDWIYTHWVSQFGVYALTDGL